MNKQHIRSENHKFQAARVLPIFLGDLCPIACPIDIPTHHKNRWNDTSPTTDLDMATPSAWPSWPFWSSYGWNLAMDQYLLIPFLGGWTSIYIPFTSYFDVNYRGTIGFDTLPFQANRNQKPLWHVEQPGAARVKWCTPCGSIAGELRFVRPGDEMDAAGNAMNASRNRIHSMNAWTHHVPNAQEAKFLSNFQRQSDWKMMTFNPSWWSLQLVHPLEQVYSYIYIYTEYHRIMFIWFDIWIGGDGSF